MASNKMRRLNSPCQGKAGSKISMLVNGSLSSPQHPAYNGNPACYVRSTDGMTPPR